MHGLGTVAIQSRCEADPLPRRMRHGCGENALERFWQRCQCHRSVTSQDPDKVAWLVLAIELIFQHPCPGRAAGTG